MRCRRLRRQNRGFFFKGNGLKIYVINADVGNWRKRGIRGMKSKLVSPCILKICVSLRNGRKNRGVFLKMFNKPLKRQLRVKSKQVNKSGKHGGRGRRRQRGIIEGGFFFVSAEERSRRMH
jgi:hypothetical protein